MAKKELVISAKLALQSEEFMNGIKAAQEQLNKMQSTVAINQAQNQLNQRFQQLGIRGPGAVPQDKMIRDARKAETDEMKFLLEKGKALERVNNLIAQQEKSLQGLIKAGASQIEQDKVRANLAKSEELRASFAGKSTAAAEAAYAKTPLGRITQGYATGGIRGALEGGGAALGMGAAASMVAASAIVGAGIMASKLIQDYAQRPVSLAALQGSAMQGFLGKQLSQMQTGESVFEGGGIFGEERQKAVTAARASRWRQENLSDVIGLLNPFSERSRAKLFDQQKYQTMLAAEEAESTGTAFEGFKGQKVFDKDASERLRRNLYRDLGMQRTLGLSDKGLTEYQLGILGAGFTEEQGFGATSAILGAGGSTAMGQLPGAKMALRAERGLHMTNAAQLLGQLSGAAGMPQTSKDMLIEIFSTAQAIGLDKSDYAQENRKFMEQVTDIASKAGIGTRQGAAAIAEGLGEFTGGERTIRGIERGRTAYQAYQAAISTTTGYQGAINMASMMKNPALMKAVGGDVRMLESLASMTDAEIEASGTFLEPLAQRAGMSLEDFKATLKKTKYGGATAGLQIGGAGTLKKFSDQLRKHIAAGGTRETFKPTAEWSTAAAAVQKARAAEGRKLTIPEAQQELMGEVTQQMDIEDREAEARRRAKDKMMGPLIPTEYQMKRSKIATEAERAMSEESTAEKDRDKILASSAKEAAFSVDNLAKSIDRLTDAANRNVGKNIENMESARRFQETADRAVARAPGAFSEEDIANQREISRQMAAGQTPDIGHRPGGKGLGAPIDYAQQLKRKTEQQAGVPEK